jgi:hypothetical protein
MIFSDPIVKLSFATIENYYMLIRLWIQDTLAANIFTIAIGKQAQFRHKVFMMFLNKGKITKEMIAMFSTRGYSSTGDPHFNFK